MKRTILILVLVAFFVLCCLVFLVARHNRRVPLTSQEMAEIEKVVGLTIPKAGLERFRVLFDYRPRKMIFMYVRLDCTCQAAQALVSSSWLKSCRAQRAYLPSKKTIAWWDDFQKELGTDQCFINNRLHTKVLIREQGDMTTVYLFRTGESDLFSAPLMKQFTAYNDLPRGQRSSWMRRLCERSWP